MMGRRQGDQRLLLHELHLADVAPPIPRLAGDPVLMIRMLIVGFSRARNERFRDSDIFRRSLIELRAAQTREIPRPSQGCHTKLNRASADLPNRSPAWSDQGCC